MRIPLSTAVLCFLSSLSSAALLLPRAPPPFCSRNEVINFNSQLSKIPQIATRFCASFLTVSTPIPATVTVVQSATGVTTGTATVVVTVTSTSLTTAITTEASTVTTSIPGSTSTTTVTTTSYSAAPVLRKRAESRPQVLSKAAVSVVSQVCSCFLGLPRPTTTVTSTVATVSTTVQTTATTIVTSTQTISTTATSLSTATVTGPNGVQTSTVVVPVPVRYTLITGPGSSCTYNRYTDGFSVDNSPDNDYRVGVNQCQGYCTARTDCKFFFYRRSFHSHIFAGYADVETVRFDPARARGADYGYCFIDNLPYDPSLLQCGYPTQNYRGYNKNP
ncbi:MAG: hypothetical protein M1814_002066 [Vezdaea aestivalis]|nr:MAG: hypothetical protein M1814_002066 [Vezdaea aestivalis]